MTSENSTSTQRGRRPAGALAGLIAAGVALGVAELVSAFIDSKSSPVVAVGGSVIDATPQLVALLRPLRAPAKADTASTGSSGVTTIGRPSKSSDESFPEKVRAYLGGVDRKGDGFDRRAFLATSLGAVAVAGVAGGAGRVAIGKRFDVTASRAAVTLPMPMSPAKALPAGSELGIDGLSSFRTPNKDFYRVDTALIVPQVSSQEWRLKVHGMVDREIELDFEQLLARGLIERDITLTCVSNEVGGPYVGNARWLGAPLADLLTQAGVHREADQIVSTSTDGMTIGTPTAVIMDGRDAMLAVGMNGKPLPAEHGFPVRMVVPGLYGYVSATKWVIDIEATTFAKNRPYWVKRDWAVKAPIKTMSRIDTPRPLKKLSAGKVAVAGVAWAQHRGIAKVEVRVDGAAWNDARLAGAPSTDTWLQWVWEWDAMPGQHTLEVRATDRAGDVQTRKRANPFPSGASGWQSTVVTVA